MFAERENAECSCFGIKYSLSYRYAPSAPLRYSRCPFCASTPSAPSNYLITIYARVQTIHLSEELREMSFGELSFATDQLVENHKN